MKQLDLAGQPITPRTLIRVLKEVKKIAPARFMTMKVHPKTFDRIMDVSESQGEEMIQVGDVPGQIPGSRMMRVITVKAPSAVPHGIAIKQDPNVSESQMVFEIHGIPELVVVNIEVPGVLLNA